MAPNCSDSNLKCILKTVQNIDIYTGKEHIYKKMLQQSGAIKSNVNLQSTIETDSVLFYISIV